MKKIILSTLSVLIVGSIIFLSCKKKNDDTAITPTYKTDAANGTGNNPNITNVTTTGTLATTSVATGPSSISGIGTVGTWNGSTCSGSCIQMNNSSTGTSASVCFSTTPTPGTYNLVNNSSLLTSGPSKCFMTITNPPGQPTGSVWYSNSGLVTVTATGAGYTASFSGIGCTQTPGSFPVVTVGGQVSCF